MLTTLGGRVACRQCNARSKRTKQQCKAPAVRGKTKCRFHGGKSTGPKTAEGKARIAKAHTTHGRETTAKRRETSYKLAELYYLEQLGFSCGLFPAGTERTRGPKPKQHRRQQKEALLSPLLETLSSSQIPSLRAKASCCPASLCFRNAH